MKKLILGLLALMLILGLNGCGDSKNGEHKSNKENTAVENNIKQLFQNIEKTRTTSNVLWDVWNNSRDSCIKSKETRYMTSSDYDNMLESCDYYAKASATAAAGITQEDNTLKQSKYIDELLFFVKYNPQIKNKVKSKLKKMYTSSKGGLVGDSGDKIRKFIGL